MWCVSPSTWPRSPPPWGPGSAPPRPRCSPSATDRTRRRARRCFTPAPTAWWTPRRSPTSSFPWRSAPGPRGGAGGGGGGRRGRPARPTPAQSPRAGKAYFELRLAGRNPAYLESVIFGHEKGAFVEATERRRGLLELADGGTLLLPIG